MSKSVLITYIYTSGQYLKLISLIYFYIATQLLKSRFFCKDLWFWKYVCKVYCHLIRHRSFKNIWIELYMGLLPNTSNCGCACAGNAGNVFPATTGKQSRHASRHVRDARAVMHAGIANSCFPLNSAAGGNVPGIPGACATLDFTYLVRGPWNYGIIFRGHFLLNTSLITQLFRESH